LVDDPPFHGRGDATEIGPGHGFEDDQDVEVGMIPMKVTAGRGAIEDNGMEICASHFFEAVDKVS
jgi:hypothetical protein